MHYTGIDLHKDNCMLTTYTRSGDVVKSEKLNNDKRIILEYFNILGGKHKAVVESTSNWYWLNDLLEEKGIELQLAHSKHLKAIAYAKVKTDKVDSDTLAKLLRGEMIPTAHKISKENRGLRDIMRMRLKFVQKRTACYNAIHHIADKFNLDNEVNVDKCTIPLGLPEEYKLQARFFYQQIDLLNRQINELEKSLYPLLIPNDDIQRLLWVPAFGLITAFTIYLEIDGIDRFNSDKQLFSYSRLVPGAKNSNHKHRQRTGNKEGNKYLKIAFTDAAVHAIRYYTEIRAYYHKVLRHSNQAIARTVVAKELARIAFHILKYKQEFKGFKGKPLSRQKKLNWPRLTNPRFGLAQQ